MKILITGANGFIGSRMTEFFLIQGIHTIYAVDSSEINSENNPVDKSNRLTQFSIDLIKPLPDYFDAIIKNSDVIVHLAWTRKGNLKENIRLNQIMVDQLLDRIRNKNNFYFFSSVTGTPETFSNYGKSKFFLTSHILKKQGTVLTCGLVIEKEPQAGSYKLLFNLVKNHKYSFRLITNDLKVYPVRISDIIKGVDHIMNQNLPSGAYKLFSQGISFNDFIALLEQMFERKRKKFYLPHKMLVSFFRIAILISPNIRIIEQFLTFFYKDSSYLDGLSDIPGLTLTPCESVVFFN
jgi:nucleoside-diphosphate-sugar epimerase